MCNGVQAYTESCMGLTQTSDDPMQAERGFGKVTGVDYSERAIELAKQVAQMEEVSAEFLVSEITTS